MGRRAICDGTLFYLSGDGPRVRRRTGTVERVPWPVRAAVPIPAPTLLRNIRIIDGTGTPPSAARDVLIERARIVRIAPTGTIVPARDTRVVDGGGRIVIPGLMDAHQHLFSADERMLPALLYHGVTTIRALHGRVSWVAAKRDAVQTGQYPGPRMILGPHFAPGCYLEDCVTGEDMQRTAGRDDGRRGLALAKAMGADWAKMYIPFSSRAGARFIQDAHALGMRITGHLAFTLPLLAAGMDGKEHGAQGWDRSLPSLQEDLAVMARLSGLTVTPTLAVAAQIPRLLDDPTPLNEPATALLLPASQRVPGLVRAENRAWAEAWVREWRTRVARYRAAGVPLAVGTDASLPWLVHTELEELVKAGLTPLEALAAGTSATARALGVEGQLGTIEPGKLADLLIVDGDPSADIRDTRRIWKIIRGGEVVEREALLATLRGEPSFDPTSRTSRP